MSPRVRILAYFSAGEVETPLEQAVVEERYRALRRQVPLVYLVALVNLFGLQLGTVGKVTIGANLPTVLLLWSAIRILQWLRADKHELSHDDMLARLRQTKCLAAGLSLLICGWCLQLLSIADPTSEMAITLFGSLTAIGTAYGLSNFPAAARLPLLVLAFPLAGKALFSNNPLFVGAAISLAVVSLLILRLLTVHNAQFIDLIRSRSIILVEQERARASHRSALEASMTDFLTGLPNRRAFMDAIHEELVDGANRSKFAVAIVDLDRFKPINDTFGHATGDELLRTVADRLKNAVTSK
jgi:predicted signal transduction protein with EAL and GGDEF domain